MFKLFDLDRNGIIEREEWMAKSAKGVRLPDFGVSRLNLGGLVRMFSGYRKIEDSRGTQIEA